MAGTGTSDTRHNGEPIGVTRASPTAICVLHPASPIIEVISTANTDLLRDLLQDATGDAGVYSLFHDYTVDPSVPGSDRPAAGDVIGPWAIIHAIGLLLHGRLEYRLSFPKGNAIVRPDEEPALGHEDRTQRTRLFHTLLQHVAPQPPDFRPSAGFLAIIAHPPADPLSTAPDVCWTAHKRSWITPALGFCLAAERLYT